MKLLLIILLSGIAYATTYEKIDTTTIKVIETINKVQETKIDIRELLNEKERLTREILNSQTELAKIEALIAECKKLGI